MNSVFANVGAGVFATMSRPARERGAVNLGQAHPTRSVGRVGFAERDETLDAALVRLREVPAAPATC